MGMERYIYNNLVARARDPLSEESWGSGKKPKRMHGIHCIHYYRIQYTRQARNIRSSPCKELKMVLLERITSLVLLRTLARVLKC